MILNFLDARRARRVADANAKADGIMAGWYDEMTALVVELARAEQALADWRIDGPATREAVRRLKKHASAFALMAGLPREGIE